jgi:hypothetical protein
MKNFSVLVLLVALIATGCSKEDINNDKSGTTPDGLPTNIANNVIYYKTSNNKALQFEKDITFVKRADFVSNEYSETEGYGKITFSQDIDTIDNYAFSNQSDLTKIVLPQSVVSINDGAFSRCTNLESVSIPENLANIGVGAFHDCRSLVSIHLQNRGLGRWGLCS